MRRNLDINIEGIDEVTSRLSLISGEKAERALQVAAIRTQKSIAANAAKLLRKHLNLSSAAIKSAIRVRKSEILGSESVAVVSISGSPIPVVIGKSKNNPPSYGAKAFYTNRKQKRVLKRVKFWVRKDTGWEEFRHAVIKNDNRVFLIEKKRRRRLIQMRGPSIPGALKNKPGMLDTVVNEGADEYVRILNNQIDRHLQGV